MTNHKTSKNLVQRVIQMARDVYNFVVTITNGTTKLTKLAETIRTTGIIRQIIIDIPSNVAAVAGILFKFGKAGTLPITDGRDESNDTITGDDINLPLKPDVELKEDSIEIWGLNSGGSNHTFIVTVEIER